MKMYVLDLGKIVMVGDNPVVQSAAGSGDSAERTLDSYPAIPVSAFLIDSPIGYILFDAGCHPDAMKGFWPEAMCANPYVYDDGMTLLRRLSDIGVKPEEVKYIVLSHLHLDHAGCIHQFPNAEVYVQTDEYERTMADYRAGSLDEFHLKCDIENWLASGVKWRSISRDGFEPYELCPGVSILDLKAGHSFGMLALFVELENESFLLASDAIYSAYHYGPPARFSGAVTDEEGYMAAIEFLRKFSEEKKARVLFGHDMDQFKGLIKSDGGCYR